MDFSFVNVIDDLDSVVPVATAVGAYILYYVVSFIAEDEVLREALHVFKVPGKRKVDAN